jgi:hypothetical protein
VAVQLLPGLSANAGHPWEPHLLLAFADALLAWMYQQAQQHPGQQMYFTYNHAQRKVFGELSTADGGMLSRLQQLLPRQP